MNEATREAVRDLLGSSVVEVHDLRYEAVSRKVWRVRAAGHPESVIIKEAVAGTERADDAWTFIERDGRSLDAAAKSGVVPTVLALDTQRRLLIMEDLGQGASLATALLGDDEAAARQALTAYGAALGRVHAATRSSGPAEKGVNLAGVPTERIEALRLPLRTIGVAIPDDVLAELETVSLELTEPGAATTLVHGDPCPDNTLLRDSTLALFDFEWAGRGSALLDAAYLHMPFPSCWCAAVLPGDAITEAEAAYRQEFPLDDSSYLDGLASAVVAWCVATISWDTDRFEGEDRAWGIANRRPRHITRLRSARRVCERAGRFPAFAAFTSTLEAAFTAQWPDAADGLALYPAFAS